jgi:hypothetical protein
VTSLELHGESVDTIFDIVGHNENAMTHSLGWVLSQCRPFLDLLAKKLKIEDGFSDKVRIELQCYKSSKGFTDLEIIDPGNIHIIIEAKRGFIIPGNDQLEKYADRLLDSKDADKHMLVVLAESDRGEEWLCHNISSEVKGIPLRSISWKQFQNLMYEAIQYGSHAEKRLLHDLRQYLGKVTTMQNQNSNSVYVVSVSYDRFEGSDITFVDVIEKFGKYFHPVGGNGAKGGWPIDPPNYIAFRYDGKLQSIHHIKEYTVIKDFNDAFPMGKATPCNGPHFLYDLGPAIKPTKEIRTNDREKRFPQVVMSSRRWCDIDLLLTSDSVAEASALTSERRNKTLGEVA